MLAVSLFSLHEVVVNKLIRLIRSGVCAQSITFSSPFHEVFNAVIKSNLKVTETKLFCLYPVLFNWSENPLVFFDHFNSQELNFTFGLFYISEWMHFCQLTTMTQTDENVKIVRFFLDFKFQANRLWWQRPNFMFSAQLSALFRC